MDTVCGRAKIVVNLNDAFGPIQSNSCKILNLSLQIQPIPLPYHNCHAPLHEECSKHHGHKGDPGITSDPSVDEGPEYWERLPPSHTRSHELCVAYGVPIL